MPVRAWFCLILLALPASAQFRSLAPFQTEEQAVARGEELGLGEALLLGPDAAVVGTYGEFTLRFTIGRAGMATGGGLRIATAHDFGWDMWGGTRLQTTDALEPNFLTFRTSTGARLEWKPWAQGGDRSLFQEYHPWQTINEFTLQGEALSEGDWIEIVFGDRRGGSPGVEIQPMDETAFEQKIYVDSLGGGDFLPLAKNPSIRVLPGEGKELQVVAPSDWVVGRPGWVNVWVDDGLGNPAVSYRDAVAVTAEPASGRLPGEHAYTGADLGAYRFEGLTFDRPGVYRIRARDRSGRQATSNPFTVHTAPPETSIYWGDLHTHTKYSDGRGTPDEMFDFGKRYAALDFCAISDHAFITTDAMWEDIVRATGEFHEPGRYVTFLGYEWSGRSEVGGDHNVYTTEDSMPLIRSYNGYNYRNLRMYHGPNKQANHVEDLFRTLTENYDDENLLVIPHYGGRRGNPEWHNPTLQRGIEVFSDHRRSEDWVATFLEKGYRIGVMASTDNHSGNAGYGIRRIDRTVGDEGPVFSRFSPAERGTSLVAVYGEDLTREGVFQGLYHRRTYATTGSRILLRFDANGEPMGGEIRAAGPVKLRVAAVGTTGLKTVRIVKNGKIIHAVEPDSDRTELEYTDQSAGGETAFYYVDLVQTDGEKAISSPVWVN